MNVSVCIATYNGERFIEEQLESILKQISSEDEIIIVDDCSHDTTLEIVNSFKDERIKIFKNDKNQSHVYTFNRTIELANNELIVMADQDDIWTDHRLTKMKNVCIQKKCLLLSSRSRYINQYGEAINYNDYPILEKDSNKYLKNIYSIFTGKTYYYGCLMAFDRKMKNYIMPIPSFVESHDLWIAIAGNLLRSNYHLEEFTLLRRVHQNNASIIKRKLIPKIYSRWIFILSIIVLYYRIIKIKLTFDNNGK